MHVREFVFGPPHRRAPVGLLTSVFCNPKIPIPPSIPIRRDAEMVHMPKLCCAAVLVVLFAGSVSLAQEPGTVKWVFSPPNTWELDSAPAIARDGTIYVADRYRYLWALYPDGGLKWQFEAQDGFTTTAPAVASDGTVYIVDDEDNFYCIRPDGTLHWSWTGPDNQDFQWTPAIAANGTIYLTSTDEGVHNLFAFNPDGTVRWSTEASAWITSSPSIGPNGTIYVVADARILDAFNPDGSPAWSYQMDVEGNAQWINSSPAIGPDGAIYAVGGPLDDPASSP